MRLVALAVLGLTLGVVSLGCGGGETPATAAQRAAYTRTCDTTSSVRVKSATSRDARLGRAQLVSFRELFENAEADEVYQPEPGVRVLKAALVFKGQRDLTIAVAPELKGVLALDYGGRDEGYHSIRFRSCARGKRGTGYPGSLIYTGPWPACVPLDVRVGTRPAKRYLLSFGAGRCKSPG